MPENNEGRLRVLVAGQAGVDKAALTSLMTRHECVEIDSPGQAGLVRAAVTGARAIDAAVLLINAGAGRQEEYAAPLPLLGISQVVVVLNSAAEPDDRNFERLRTELSGYLDTLGVTPQHFIPVSLAQGNNIDAGSSRPAWYSGPSLSDALDGFRATVSPEDLPLRLVIQDTFRLDKRRVLAGRLETGRLSVGDELVFRPDGKRCRLKSIEAWDGREAPQSASAGQFVVIALDGAIFAERGQIASHPRVGPAEGREIRATIFWEGEEPLSTNGSFVLNPGAQTVEAQVVDILAVFDPSKPGMLPGPRGSVHKNQAADVRIRCRKPIAFDRQDFVAETSRFTMSFGGMIVGAGTVREAEYDESEAAVASDNITWTTSPVTREARTGLLGHRGAVVWLTGLSASGKSTLAVGLEWKLHMLGMAVFILDGDNLRHGLCSNLKFSPEDRSENIRRAGETAKLMAEAGVIVICSLISPYATDRSRVREICQKDGIPYAEIFVNTPIEVCEARDPRGLYKKARAGEIRDFTGIGSAYEPPEDPDLEILTAENPLPRCLEMLQEHVVSLTRPSQAGTSHEFDGGSGI